VLRIVAALVFMQHGMQKLFHFPPGGHNPEPIPLFSLVEAGGILEFFGGSILALGLYTRPIAFILSGEMAFAYFWFHVPAGMAMSGGMFPVVNGGDLAIVFCFLYLYIFFAGPGPWSLDFAFRRRYLPECIDYFARAAEKDR
jgi:putative oxidoreductase